MAKMRFRVRLRRRGGERPVVSGGRFRRPKPLPAVSFEGVPPVVLDLGTVGEEQATPVDLGTIAWPPS